MGPSVIRGMWVKKASGVGDGRRFAQGLPWAVNSWLRRQAGAAMVAVSGEVCRGSSIPGSERH